MSLRILWSPGFCPRPHKSRSEQDRDYFWESLYMRRCIFVAHTSRPILVHIDSCKYRFLYIFARPGHCFLPYSEYAIPVYIRLGNHADHPYQVSPLLSLMKTQEYLCHMQDTCGTLTLRTSFLGHLQTSNTVFPSRQHFDLREGSSTIYHTNQSLICILHIKAAIYRCLQARGISFDARKAKEIIPPGC
jgi:hypothetical protein